MHLKGTITALITPFDNHQIDEKGLRHHIRFQISRGINGVLVLGSTGESSTLTPEEQKKIVAIAVDEAKGKVPLWVGTGSYSTQQTIEKTRLAKELGADIALIVTPYFNRPTQEGIFRHFEAVSSAVKIPIVVYNIPGRCGTNIEVSTLLRIAGLPNVVGIKESTGNITQTNDFIHTVVSKYPHFCVLSGDDAMTLPMVSLGATGVISVLSNLMPREVNDLVNAALDGNYHLARQLHYQLLPICKALFVETNPVPIKTAMELCGMPSGGCRLPLYKMQPENLQLLRQVLTGMKLIKSQASK